MNKKYKIVLVLLIVIVAISSYFIIKEFAENNIKIEKKSKNLLTI